MGDACAAVKMRRIITWPPDRVFPARAETYKWRTQNNSCRRTALRKNSSSPVAGQPAAGADTPLRHIGIYGYRAGFLRRFPQLPVSPLERLESLEQLRVLWHGERIAVHVTPHAPGAGVDTPEDLARVRALFGA